MVIFEAVKCSIQDVLWPKKNPSKLVLSPSQKRIFDLFQIFIKSPQQQVFILNGFAGTGKTTLVYEFVNYLERESINFFLLASTGRAAKVISSKTGYIAKTVHSRIYRFTELNQSLEDLVITSYSIHYTKLYERARVPYATVRALRRARLLQIVQIATDRRW